MYSYFSFYFSSKVKRWVTLVFLDVTAFLACYLAESLLLACLIFRHFQVVDQSFDSQRCHLLNLSIVVKHFLIDILFDEQPFDINFFRLIKLIFLLLLDIFINDRINFFLGHVIFLNLL